MPSDDLPEEVKERAEAIKEDDPSISESEAIAIARDQLNLASDDDCPDGHTKVRGECVPIPESEHVNAPPSILNSQPRIMASASPLDTQPIEREELDGDKVAYRGLKLIDSGVWTDSGSETPTLYDERTFENTTADYDEGKYDGPPVNIAHDIHKTGPNRGDPHEASVGGHIDPESIETDGEALFGDVILDRGTDAGAFADTNLKSALENDGTAGFSPSVELMPTELEEANHSHAEEYVKAADLTGMGLVRDPASKSVDLAYETQNRAVAMSAGGGESNPNAKVLTLQDGSMSEDTIAAIRAEVMQRSLSMEDVEDDAQNIADELDVPIDDVMEVLDPLLDMDDDEPEEGEGEPPEMEDGEEDEDEEEDDETEMQDGEDMEAMQEQLANLSSRLEDVEDALSQAMTADDVDAELEDAAGNKLADADTVAELEEAREELDRRLEALEEQPGESKTLADNDSDVDWSDADSGIDYDPATGSMSR